MIKAQMIGHLGQDAVIRSVNGKNVINFSVAHTEKWNNSAGVSQQKTVWLECNYWQDKTAIAQYLKKGTQVYVEGVPEVRQWEKDGRHGANMTLRVSSIQLLGGKPAEAAAAQSTPASEEPSFDPNSDSLPF
jgi:single-strand DNA-binding protein